jgi:hypothetical protein
MCAAALLFVLLGASSASANINICVGDDATNVCPSNSVLVDDLDEAAAAATDSSMNTVYVTSGDYATDAGVVFTNRVTIKGYGATRPSLAINFHPTYPDDTAVLTTLGGGEIENLEIDLPTSMDLIGIRGGFYPPKITNVSVQGPTADNSTGIFVDGAGPKIFGSTINLGGLTSTGVYVDGAGSAAIDDLTIAHASTGIELSTSSNFKLSRLNIRAGDGVIADASNGTISSSLFLPSTVPSENVAGSGLVAHADGGETKLIRVDNCTFVGGGSVANGVNVLADDLSTSLSVPINSSIVTGYTTSVAVATSGGATASATLDYSRFTSAPQNTATVHGSSQLVSNGDLGFVNAAGGDYSLALTSPLVDAGDPANPDSTDSPIDAAGNSRVVSRGAGNVRDIGAFEVQNSAPVPRPQVVTAVPSTTSNVQFSGAASSDADGDALTYDWKFDGVPGISGVTAQKMFIQDGPHTVTLTVTDKTGASRSASSQFNVARGFLAIKLRSQNATISKKGTFKITMSCPAEAISDCSGRLLFQTTKKVVAQNYTKRPDWSAVAKSKKKAAYLEAARYVFSIAPGSTQKLEVRTYSTFQNVLGVHKKFQLQSQLVSGTTTNANLTANRATFTISAPKSSKKK